MKTYITVLGLLVAQGALASGWECAQERGPLRVLIQEESSREGTLMVLSNQAVGPGRKTIAKFSEANRTLRAFSHEEFRAKVDLRFVDSRRGGELLAGTRLNQIDEILLSIGQGEDGVTEGVEASVEIIKRNGDVTQTEALYCNELE